jgi:Putative S-adenosyl-L-methionine-dependent methyltransferase
VPRLSSLKFAFTYCVKVVTQFPASRSALQSVHLIENSHTMQAIQEEKLLLASRVGPWELSWHDSLDDVQQETGDYTMLVAHEFFDALPIHVLEVNFPYHDHISYSKCILLYKNFRELSKDGTKF